MNTTRTTAHEHKICDTSNILRDHMLTKNHILFTSGICHNNPRLAAGTYDMMLACGLFNLSALNIVAQYLSAPVLQLIKSKQPKLLIELSKHYVRRYLRLNECIQKIK